MKPSEKQLLIATGNKGKLAELKAMFIEFPITLLSLDDFPSAPEVEESGSSFAENACLKARGYALCTGLLTLADDSGLEIEALDGRPGVLSARYGGDETGFDTKMAMLLQELAASGETKRRARFVCCIAISRADGRIIHESEGISNGVIAAEPRGSGGFGYDPIFMADGHTLTFAELPAITKQEISHRTRAFRSVIPFLQDFIAN